MQLCEEYRPRQWCDVLGQDKIIRRIDVLRRRGLGGRAYWISGSTGTGIDAYLSLYYPWTSFNPRRIIWEGRKSPESQLHATVVGASSRPARAVTENTVPADVSALPRQLGTLANVNYWPARRAGKHLLRSKAEQAPSIVVSPASNCTLPKRPASNVATNYGIEARARGMSSTRDATYIAFLPSKCLVARSGREKWYITRMAMSAITRLKTLLSCSTKAYTPHYTTRKIESVRSLDVIESTQLRDCAKSIGGANGMRRNRPTNLRAVLQDIEFGIMAE